MERLKQRIKTANDALASFREVLDQPFSTIVRDAAIQRFEFTVEAVWKLAQLYLYAQEGIESNSPKGVIRECFQTGFLNEEQAELALTMMDDRNLTVHTYNESLAEEIYEKLPGYYELTNALVAKIREKVSC
jgi:nucleotidyltransferase substrate binding protein (TIGR01987 family)